MKMNAKKKINKKRNETVTQKVLIFRGMENMKIFIILDLNECACCDYYSRTGVERPPHWPKICSLKTSGHWQQV